MADKIVLIDGHSILHRAFYGVPDLTNAEGLHTNAIYGFLNILLKITDQEQPAFLIVTFDAPGPTFRHEMYQDYKGTRKPMADELRQQVPVLKEVLAAMGVYTTEKPGLEADDLLGTLSHICQEKGMDVSIISGDRDMLQLATKQVRIRIPKTKGGATQVEDYCAQDVQRVYGVTPTEYIDVKALMGDSSDNIPGVPGIGEKTATKIIAQYGSIENAYAHASEIKPPRAGENLQKFWEQAKMSKVLATINTHADLSIDFEQARYTNPYTKQAYPLFLRLQFQNILSRFPKDLSENRVEDSFREIRTPEEMEQVFEEAMHAPKVGLSICSDEEAVLPLFAHPSGYGRVGICFGQETYSIPGEGREGMERLFERIRQLAEKSPCVALFDIKKYLPVVSLQERDTYFDSKLAAYLLNPLKNQYTYVDVAREQLHLLLDEEKLDAHQRACYEAYTALHGIEPLQESLANAHMDNVFFQVEMPLLFTLFRMEQAGICVQREELAAYGKRLGERIGKLEQEIYEEAGEVFNLNSPKQLGIVLFEHMNLPGGKKTKTGYSTAADVLEKLAPTAPIVSKILEYRQLAKLKSTYADGLVACIGGDGRIHGKFHQTTTATGRISSTEPNLQNIPVRMELGRLIRKVFVPREGYVFVDADYSQIELRILAHCSGDSQLIQAYREAKDIHRMTASQVFHVPFEEVTPLQRRNAKAVNFGIVYGISSFGLSQDLSITPKEAGAYIESYFQTYPGIKRFLDQTVKEAKEKGYVTTLFGRRRPLPELASSNFMQRSFGERAAMNAPIQGTAADIIKMAMIAVDREFQKQQMASRLILQVHDELLVEAKQSEVVQVQQILKEKMEGAVSLSVPLLVDMHTGGSWYDAK